MNNRIIPLPPTDNERITERDAQYRHIVPLQVRFNDIDLVGHVNNAVYLEFFDLGKTRYMATVFGDDFDMSAVRAVIVHTSCNYFAPTYLHDNIAVVTRTTRISRHSITMEQRVVDPDTGQVKSQCTTILAGYDPVTRGSAEIPDEYADAIRQFEENPEL